jgi:hypothetical protein
LAGGVEEVEAVRRSVDREFLHLLCSELAFLPFNRYT